MDESGRITPSAYVRDPLRDPDGLSVNMHGLTNVDGWLSGEFNKSFGADTLHTGRVRALGLEIGQTEKDLLDEKGHALIVGVPTVEEDEQKAEDLATALRDMSRKLDRVVRKRKP